MSNFADFLVEQASLPLNDVTKAIKYQKRFGGKLEAILVNLGVLSEEEIPNLLSQYLSLPRYTPEMWQESSANDFPSEHLEFLSANGWIPIACAANKTTFLTTEPLHLSVNNYLIENAFNYDMVVGTESELSEVMQHFELAKEAVEDDVSYSDEEDKLRELATEAPTVNLLNNLITKALKAGASDMHLEPAKERFRVRFRIDGVLKEVESIPKKMQLPVITRLKILSGMDIAEKRRPQDGKIEMKIAGKEIDIRVSALPLNESESVVMRFLRKDNVQYDMSVIGLSKDIDELIKEDLKTTAGVILLTGPTGSGKTTTLYTFLNALNNDDVKIITLEDPVEYQLPGINQVQVNSDIGFDFSAGLRSIVRQDPDIIMLGEIRDKETAQIAMQSALTGHLVFSTVHTNDAASAFTRLIDLGVEEFLLNAALISIVAQRLARKLCPHCATDVDDSVKSEIITKYNLDQLAQKFNFEHINLKQANGCDECAHQGYKGRMAIIEYLACDDDIKAMPKDAEFIPKAKQHNHQLNRRTLLEDGLYKVMQGLTTIDEVVRVSG